MSKEKTLFFVIMKDIAKKQAHSHMKAIDYTFTKNELKWFSHWVTKAYGQEVRENEIILLADILVEKGLMSKELVSKQHASEWKHKGNRVNGTKSWSKKETPTVTEYKEWEYRLTNKAMEYIETLRNQTKEK